MEAEWILAWKRGFRGGVLTLVWVFKAWQGVSVRKPKENGRTWKSRISKHYNKEVSHHYRHPGKLTVFPRDFPRFFLGHGFAGRQHGEPTWKQGCSSGPFFLSKRCGNLTAPLSRSKKWTIWHKMMHPSRFNITPQTSGGWKTAFPFEKVTF